MWMMVLCCAAPALALLSIFLFGSHFPAVSAFLLSIVPFLCPVFMIGMIPFMLARGKREDRRARNPEPVESEEKDKPRYLP